MNKFYDVMVKIFKLMKRCEMMIEFFWEIMNDFFGDILIDFYVGL